MPGYLFLAHAELAVENMVFTSLPACLNSVVNAAVST